MSLKVMTKRIIIDSLISRESFHCLRCNKEIRRDTEKAEFITPHILIQKKEEYQFLCSTCYNQEKYHPTGKKNFYYRKCANTKCTNRFYVPLEDKDTIKHCSDTCNSAKVTVLEFKGLHTGMSMFWEG